jgi:MOSC domain-containing protein YiiM
VPESRVDAGGVSGDWQKNRKHHGGPDRAVCLYSMERIDALRGEGHPIAPGAIGENLTLAGLEWERLVPGVRLRVGADVLLEITSYTTPCRTIAGAFADGRSTRVSQKLHPGWSRVYARVLAAGTVRVGDPVALVAAPP